jgi:hypothetical protein
VIDLGEVVVTTEESDCMYGYRKLSGADFAFSVQDHWERDRVQFQAAIHNIRPEAVQKRLLQMQ